MDGKSSEMVGTKQKVKLLEESRAKVKSPAHSSSISKLETSKDIGSIGDSEPVVGSVAESLPVKPKLVRKRRRRKAVESDSKRSKTEDKLSLPEKVPSKMTLSQSIVENNFSSESSDGGESKETEESSENNLTLNEILRNRTESVSSLALSGDALPRLAEKTNFSSESSDGDASTDTEECSVNDKKVRKVLEDSESDTYPKPQKVSNGGETCFICGKIVKDIKSHKEKVHTRPKF